MSRIETSPWRGVRRPSRVASGLVFLTAVVFAGCSASDNDQTGAPSSTSTGPESTEPTAGPAASAVGSPGCALVPAALVSEHIGMAVKEPAASRSGSSAICNYDSPDGTQLVVRLRSPTTAGDFAKDKAGFVGGGAPVADVPDVGDEAFSASVTFLGRTTNSFAVRKGDVDVLISAKVPIDKVRSLATAIVAML